MSRKEDSNVFFCVCGGEELVVENEPDYEQITFSLWKSGCYSGQKDWRWRLRYLWRILRGKDLYTDFMFLNYDDVEVLGHTLLGYVDASKQLNSGGVKHAESLDKGTEEAQIQP